MSLNKLREWLRKQPFELFRIVMSGGETHEVHHSGMALLLKGGIEVAEPTIAGKLPDTSTFCSLLHVTAIEPIAAKNGKRTRKK
jgi:hypothetical protein